MAKCRISEFSGRFNWSGYRNFPETSWNDNALKTINDNYEKYFVSMDDMQFESNEGIGHVQAWRLDELL